MTAGVERVEPGTAINVELITIFFLQSVGV